MENNTTRFKNAIDEMPERIKKAMEVKNLTNEKLAEKVEVDPRTISRWRNNKNIPSMELRNFAVLCEVLEVSPNYLLGFEETKNLPLN